MDSFRERFEALEQQTAHLQHETYALKAHIRTAHRRLRWWRGIACGGMLLGLVSLPLHPGIAADPQPQGTAARLAALEHKLSALTFNQTTNEVVIAGANLRIVNGLGSTETTNGLGNLIVGYNESRGAGFDLRTGSHTVVVGQGHNFSSFGGVVVGTHNGISGQFASVTGGTSNAATGDSASVTGGFANHASGGTSTVTGGTANIAVAGGSTVSGGHDNAATGDTSWVGGGAENNASGEFAAVSGGIMNVASGPESTVTGGGDNTAAGGGTWIGGGGNRTVN